MKNMRSVHQRPVRHRSGLAATEFAVCLPILLAIVIGTIEACSMVYLKQSLSVAAYEGARAALRAGGRRSLSADSHCPQRQRSGNYNHSERLCDPPGSNVDHS